MKINLEKIEEIYGKNSLYEIKDNLDTVLENIDCLLKYQITNIDEILECYPYIFLESEDIFQQKIDHFIMYLGDNYQKKLEEDISLWGELT